MNIRLRRLVALGILTIAVYCWLSIANITEPSVGPQTQSRELYNAGYNYLKAGQYEAAINSFRQSIRIEPGFYAMNSKN